jgi:hypothetical protein
VPYEDFLFDFPFTTQARQLDRNFASRTLYQQIGDLKKNMAPRARFELATLRLTAECSTVELPGNWQSNFDSTTLCGGFANILIHFHVSFFPPVRIFRR